MTTRKKENGVEVAEQLPRKRAFTAQYRIQAVQPVLDGHKTQSQQAHDLQISVKTFANWVKLARLGKLERVDSHRLQPVSERDAEISRLKRELAIAREERDILKKATAYFARQSR